MPSFFVSLLTIVTVSLSVYQTAAAPIESRQIGGIACNVARLKTVSGLAATTKAVNAISSAAGSDATTTAAVATAQSGLQSASSGIKTIAGALLTGQAAPANARDQVGQGLLTAQTALQGINASDASTSSLVSTALTKLQGTISAGQDVVSQCGSGSGAAAAASKAKKPFSALFRRESEDLDSRQIGGLGCNIARLQTVTALKASTSAVASVLTAAEGDAATTAAATQAQSALSTAKAGVAAIAATILKGQSAPAAARDQVAQGLTDAQTALSGITSTSPSVTSAVATAQKDLARTVSAGTAVVSKCQ